MADLAQLRTWLSEAQEARHKRASGQSVKGVARAGRSMSFDTMTDQDFERYIAYLERQIEMAEAEEAGRPRRRAIGTYW